MYNTLDKFDATFCLCFHVSRVYPFYFELSIQLRQSSYWMVDHINQLFQINVGPHQTNLNPSFPYLSTMLLFICLRINVRTFLYRFQK